MASSRNTWVERAWSRDTSAVSRWFYVRTEIEYGTGERVLLLCRIVGWDGSELPDWISSSRNGRVVTTVEEKSVTSTVSELLEGTVGEAAVQGFEIRRVEAPVIDWLELVSAKGWGLRVPLVLYEIWPRSDAYGRASAAWELLSPSERDATGILGSQLGHLAATVLLVPQLRPYFVGVHDLVIPGGFASAPSDLQIISEVLDGAVVLSRLSTDIRPEPWRKLDEVERLQYLSLHYPEATLAAMHRADVDDDADAIAAYPDDAHGCSGSDWRVSICGRGGVCDAVTIGLIRGLGGGYFTSEPWRNRSPGLGFSAPARVHYFPPSAHAGGAAVLELEHVGAPANICDPYADTASADRLRAVLRGGRLLTRSQGLAARLDRRWADSVGLDVRVAGRLHDRFVMGPRGGFLIGTSLNGLGSKHCFAVELDNVMRLQVSQVFEQLWNTASPAWP